MCQLDTWHIFDPKCRWCYRGIDTRINWCQLLWTTGYG